MLFPTISFAIFFPLVFAVAWAMRERNFWRKVFLLGASYLFYGWWDWRFCFLLLFASLVAWSAGLVLNPGSHVAEKTRKRALIAAIGALLMVLGFFKYYGFFLTSLQDLLFAIGLERDLPFMQIILPVGISFFTFQAISYTVDVYRSDVAARRNPLDVLLYISFFPQLVAGPIVRASAFLPQLEQRASLNRAAVSFGLTLCCIGLFKKMVIANYLAVDLVDPVFLDPGSYPAPVLLAAVYGYAVQIYCDFSGYSDIAIGTAALLGFRFKKNFNQPYRATSLQSFWRRWHISLSQWLRDYLYIPLGGSRGGTWNTYRNLFTTMFLGGLWHGAAWTFIIWGSLHGAWLAAERAIGWGDQQRSRLSTILAWLIIFHVVCAGWVFFRAEDLSIALQWFAGLATFSLDGEMVLEPMTLFGIALIVLSMAGHFLPPNTVEWCASWLEKQPFYVTVSVVILALLATLWIAPSGTAPFIYFQF